MASTAQEVRKIVVRNNQRPAPKMKTKCGKNPAQFHIVPKLNLGLKTERSCGPPIVATPRERDLTKPKQNFSREINLRTKLISQPPEILHKLTSEGVGIINESITRSLNFRPDKVVFKNLIPLLYEAVTVTTEDCIDGTGITEASKAQNANATAVQRDIEPNLLHIIRKKEIKEYLYVVPKQPRSEKQFKEFEGLQIIEDFNFE